MTRLCRVVLVVVSVLALHANARADFEEIEMTWTDVQDGILVNLVVVAGNVTSPGGETEGSTIVLQTNPGGPNQQQDSNTIGEDGDFDVTCPFVGSVPVPYGLIAFDDNDDWDTFGSLAGD